MGGNQPYRRHYAAIVGSMDNHHILDDRAENKGRHERVSNDKGTRAGQPGAIIVGASTGMGAALARQLVAKGYQVALIGRQTEKLEELANTLNAAAAAKTVPPASQSWRRRRSSMRMT